MKIFRSIGFSLAMACLGLAACAAPLLRLVEPVWEYLSYGFDGMACGVQKLKRELVQVFAQDPHHASGVGEGLTPDSNGFRQTSAVAIGAEERTALAI